MTKIVVASLLLSVILVVVASPSQLSDHSSCCFYPSQSEVVVDDVSEDNVEDRGIVLDLVDQDETSDVDDVANLRCTLASHCHQ